MTATISTGQLVVDGDTTVITIRDTNPHNTLAYGLSRFASLLFAIHNTHDQTVSVQFQGSFDEATWFDIGSAENVTTNSKVTVTLTDPWPKVRAVCTAGVAPASGTLAILWSGRNA